MWISRLSVMVTVEAIGTDELTAKQREHSSGFLKEHWRINVIMYVKYLAQWLAYTITGSSYYSKEHTGFKNKAHKELSERGIHGRLHRTLPFLIRESSL